MRHKMIFIYISVFLLLAVLIAAIGVPVFIKYDSIETNSEFQDFYLLCERGTEMRAVSERGEVVLTNRNFSRVLTLLSYTDRSFVMFPPEQPETADVTVYIGDAAVISVVSEVLDNGRDMAYIFYKYGDKQRCYSLTGYKTLQTLNTAVSPEGFSGENKVIK